MLAAAANEEPVCVDVHGQRSRSPTRRQRPAILHLKSLHVDVQGLVFLLKVDVEIPFAIGDSILGPSAKLNAAGKGAVGGVEHADAVAIAVHDVDTLGQRLLDYRVRL